MIVGERQIHHRSNHHFPGDGHRPVLDSVQTQDAALRGIEDRRAQQRTIHAAVADGEGPAFKIAQFQAIFPHLSDIVENRLFDSGEAQPVGMANDRHHQASLGADGHAKVIVVVGDDLVPLDERIDGRVFLQGRDRRFDEERHDPEGNAVAGPVGFSKPGAQSLDAAHIDFVEGGQHGRILPGCEQPFGNAPPNAAHGLAGGGFRKG